ncbi:MAG: RNA polymerase sigma factor [Imperialibacter sp.]|uniref:RNA polymerase sigma factor n=1 Tax=Imperialibacter sp. TaxID=2038411 RepID=UPI0032EDF592
MEDQKLVQRCLEGDRQSLEKLIASVKGLIFNLSVRFLYNRMDAEDATQEILLKLVTNLSKYDGRSKFTTWAYRVATNYLISQKQTKIEGILTSFDVYAADLQDFKMPTDYNLPDKTLLEKEVKTSCTLAMLQCLNREQRTAFILGSTLKINSKVGAEIMGGTPENFRKRLEQARSLLGSFLNSNCGVYNPKNSCRCSKRINTALACGRIDKANLSFTTHVDLYNDEMEELSSLSGIYHNHGTFQSTGDLIAHHHQMISSKKILSDN